MRISDCFGSIAKNALGVPGLVVECMKNDFDQLFVGNTYNVIRGYGDSSLLLDGDAMCRPATCFRKAPEKC